MRSVLIQLIHNKVLLSALCAWFIAQGSKVIMEMVKNGAKAARPAGGGGMPSAHSATVSALALSAALTAGWDSPVFAVALFFAIIVIYDAAGVRYETGQQGRILNRLRQRDLDEGKKPVYDQPLEEHMGHTIPQIIVGILIGLVTAGVLCAVM